MSATISLLSILLIVMFYAIYLVSYLCFEFQSFLAIICILTSASNLKDTIYDPKMFPEFTVVALMNDVTARDNAKFSSILDVTIAREYMHTN